jgi:outer membrane protein assembly factor BamB
LNLTDGKILWKKACRRSGHGYSYSTLVWGDLVIVPRVSQGIDKASVFTAFKKDTGEQVWVYEQPAKDRLVVIDPAGFAAGHVSPIRAKINGREQIVWYSESFFCGVDHLTGKPIWEFVTPEPLGSQDTVSCTPVVDGSIVYGVTARCGGGVSGPMAVEIDANNKPRQLWRIGSKDKKNYYEVVFGDAILKDGYLYNFGMGCPLRCVDFKTGETKWTDKSCGTEGTVIEVDGCLLCLSFDGDLALVDPKPDGFKLITDWKGGTRREKQWVQDGGLYKNGQAKPFWTAPVVARGKLYVRYSDRLTCYDLMK